MKAKFVNEKFEESSDPVKDMNIGLERLIQDIYDAIQEMDTPIWNNVEYIQDEYRLNLDSLEEYSEPNWFYSSQHMSEPWENISVYASFESTYYISIDLDQNSFERAIRVINDDIEGWEWFDRKILHEDPISLGPQKIVQLIHDDWSTYNKRKAAYDAYQYVKDYLDR